MNKIISIVSVIFLIGFSCYPSIFDDLKLAPVKENKVSEQDLVDELTCEQETIIKAFENINIKNWLVPEIEKINKKLKGYGHKKNNDSTVVNNDSLKIKKTNIK